MKKMKVFLAVCLLVVGLVPSVYGATAFDLQFETEDTSGGAAPVDLGAYDVGGNMTMPTFAWRNGNNRGTTVRGPGNGFAEGQHLSLFAHQSDYGEIRIEPPAEVTAPITGTDANPAGAAMWVFSFDMSIERDMNTDTSTWVDQPVVKLQTNRGDDSTIEDILIVRITNHRIVLDHQGGTLELVEYERNTVYSFSFILDMALDSCRVSVDGAMLPGVYGFLTGATDKGVGGLHVDMKTLHYSFYEGLNFFDNISLKTVPMTNLIENYAVSDPSTGATAMTNQTTLDLAADIFGPGYTHYIIEAALSPTAPVDGTDARWTAGNIPSTVDLGSPNDGDLLTVALWLLDEDGGIAEATQQILYATSDPGISNIQAVAEVGQITITWDTAQPASGRVLYDADGAPYDNASAFEDAVGTSHSVILTGLTPGTTYHFAVESNETVSGDNTVDYLTDTPAISNVVVTPGHYQVAFSWTTSTDALGWVELGPSGGALTPTPFTEYGTEHSVVVSGLTVATAYDYQIKSNGSSTALATVSTLDPGAFFNGFLTEDPQGRYADVDTAPYNVAGGMMMPTYATPEAVGGRFATVRPPESTGFATNNLWLFSHPAKYNGGHEGRTAIEPPPDVLEPIAGTDTNPPGKVWTFSFDISCSLGVNSRKVDVSTDNWEKQPGIELFSNRGDNGSLDKLLKVRLSENNIVLDHADGTTVLVTDYAIGSPYSIECALDMEADTFTVKVDGVLVPTPFRMISPSPTKGIGGYLARGGAWVPEPTTEGFFAMYDNISLKAVVVPNVITNFTLSDMTTGSTLATDDTTVNVSFDVAGPGYTHHMFVVGDSPVAPVDEADPRWVAGSAPATTTLGTPADGDTVQVTLYLLDANGGIADTAGTILYATGDPGISNIQAAPGALEATITWDTAVPADGRVLFDLDGPPYDNASAFEASLTTSHSVTITGLLPAQVYHFAVESNGVVSADGTFEHLMDEPVISNIQATEDEFFRSTITWETDTPAIGWVIYGPGGGSRDMMTPLETEPTSFHSITITGLEPNTTYNFQVRSNRAISEVIAFTTRDPGAFTLLFEEEEWGESIALFTDAYKTAGKMTFPTYARNNGYLSRRGTVIRPEATDGFDTQHAEVFCHSGEQGEISILPPDGVYDPITGTNNDPMGPDPWIFSFDISLEAVCDDDTSGWTYQPGIRLVTNRGGDSQTPGEIQDLIKIRLSNSSIVLDSLDAEGQPQETVLVADYLLNTVYNIACTMSMTDDTFTVAVDGSPVAGTFGFLTGPTDKGVGGFVADGHTDDWQLFQGHMWLDNISLTGGGRAWPIPGDATLDCKVNILDLIFVRNRLNQSPETGDNWRADVNEDGKINILDLIYVRNNLNTRCQD